MDPSCGRKPGTICDRAIRSFAIRTGASDRHQGRGRMGRMTDRILIPDFRGFDVVSTACSAGAGSLRFGLGAAALAIASPLKGALAALPQSGTRTLGLVSTHTNEQITGDLLARRRLRQGRAEGHQLRAARLPHRRRSRRSIRISSTCWSSCIVAPAAARPSRSSPAIARPRPTPCWSRPAAAASPSAACTWKPRRSTSASPTSR